MANSNVYMIPDGNMGTGNQLDPNMLYATLMNNGNNGFGGNGNWLWIIFLFFLYPFMNGGMWGSNGNGLGNLGGMINNNDGRELLMQAIAGNSNSIDNLASMFNTSSQNIMQAINTVNSSVSQVGNSVGLTGQQVINAVNQGNNGILSQICSASCSLRESITAGNYQNQLATLQQTNTLNSSIDDLKHTLTNNFCKLEYDAAKQFCDTRQLVSDQTRIIKDTTDAQANAIIAKLDSIENASMQNKIDNLTQQNATLTTQINLEHQNAVQAQNVAAQLQPLVAQIQTINSKVDAIENKQPTTVTTQYSPFTVVPNYGYGAAYNTSNGFWV